MSYNRAGNALILFAALFIVATNQQTWAGENSNATSPSSTGLNSTAAPLPINPAGTSAQDQPKTTTPIQLESPQPATSTQPLTLVDLPQVYRNLAQDAADVTAALKNPNLDEPAVKSLRSLFERHENDLREILHQMSMDGDSKLDPRVALRFSILTSQLRHDWALMEKRIIDNNSLPGLESPTATSNQPKQPALGSSTNKLEFPSSATSQRQLDEIIGKIEEDLANGPKDGARKDAAAVAPGPSTNPAPAPNAQGSAPQPAGPPQPAVAQTALKPSDLGSPQAGVRDPARHDLKQRSTWAAWQNVLAAREPYARALCGSADENAAVGALILEAADDNKAAIAALHRTALAITRMHSAEEALDRSIELLAFDEPEVVPALERYKNEDFRKVFDPAKARIRAQLQVKAAVQQVDCPDVPRTSPTPPATPDKTASAGSALNNMLPDTPRSMLPIVTSPQQTIMTSPATGDRPPLQTIVAPPSTGDRPVPASISPPSTGARPLQQAVVTPPGTGDRPALLGTPNSPAPGSQNGASMRARTVPENSSANRVPVPPTEVKPANVKVTEKEAPAPTTVPHVVHRTTASAPIFRRSFGGVSTFVTRPVAVQRQIAQPQVVERQVVVQQRAEPAPVRRR
jgi:hypothetical protein